MSKQIEIEVVYALPNKQSLLAVKVDEDCNIETAIAQSGILAMHDEIDLSVNKVGIWNKAKKLSEMVKAGDRIEIYRPLIADPKAVRAKRAQKAKEEGRADKVTGGRVDPQRGKR